MNKRSNTVDSTSQMKQICEALDIRPLSARSIILSALLGSHPPKLPAAALVALTELFDIRSGTARTALSRLTTQGELVSSNGWYHLAGRLLARQQEQDSGRQAPSPDWNGEWITVVVTAERRSVAERRSFRTSMDGAKMGELRPDVWMRPANLAAPSPAADTVVTVGPIVGDDADHLAMRLWPLEDLHARAEVLLSTMEYQLAELDSDDPQRLPVNFVVSAAAVRFLRSEPQLPPELWPDRWSPPAVRTTYDEFEAVFQARLSGFFASVI